MDFLFRIITYAIFGLIVGALARLLVPGRQPMSLLTTSALGIAGSMIGGLLGGFLGGATFRPAGFIMSLIGAILLLVIYVYFVKRDSRA